MNDNRTVLVCVTAQPSSGTLVRAGEIISEKSGAKLEVVSVLPIGKDEKPIDPEVIENLYQTAKNSGGDMALYFSENPIITLCAHITKKKPISLVVGLPGENSNNFVALIRMLLPDIPISMIDKKGTAYNMLPSEAAQPMNVK